MITTTEPYEVTDNPKPLFLVDFGQKVVQFDPLTLFAFTGTERWGSLFT